jgi:hypothetical protein
MGLSDRMIEYNYDIRRDVPGCAQEIGIKPDDAYLAWRAYAVGADATPHAAPLQPERLYDEARAKLVGDGWTVQEYEGPFGGAPALAATQGDRRVYYYGSSAQFSVYLGPCTRVQTVFSEPAWHPVPHGRFTTPNPPKPPIRTPTARPTTE